MLKVLHQTLLKFPPEVSHSIAKQYLRIFQKALPQKKDPTYIDVLRGGYSVRVLNRIGLAAGFDKDAEVFKALEAIGFGFLELGTVTPLPQKGNPKPRLWRLSGQALVNHMGFNSAGVHLFRKNILVLKPYVQAPLWLNIGKNRDTPNEEAHEDYWTLFEELEGVADAFVVNLSSPNTPGLVTLQNKDFLQKVLEKAPKIPLFFKLSPDLSNEQLGEICQWVRSEVKVYGVVLTNTSRRLALTLSHHENGGLSGPPLFERSLECVGIARRELGEGKIVVGVGGVDSLSKAQSMRVAGADLIELYTGFIYKGVGLIKELSQKLF